jgi:hypothetical protein
MATSTAAIARQTQLLASHHANSSSLKAGGLGGSCKRQTIARPACPFACVLAIGNVGRSHCAARSTCLAADSVIPALRADQGSLRRKARDAFHSLVPPSPLFAVWLGCQFGCQLDLPPRYPNGTIYGTALGLSNPEVMRVTNVVAHGKSLNTQNRDAYGRLREADVLKTNRLGRFVLPLPVDSSCVEYLSARRRDDRSWSCRHIHAVRSDGPPQGLLIRGLSVHKRAIP